MNISYNTSSIYVADMPKIKKDMKYIKSVYTDADMVRMGYDEIHEAYEKATGERMPWCGDVIRVNVNAFAYVWYDGGTHFSVEILNNGVDEIQEITFYATYNEEHGLEIDKEAHWNQFKMRYDYTFNVKRFKLEGSPYSRISTEGVCESV